MSAEHPVSPGSHFVPLLPCTSVDAHSAWSPRRTALAVLAAVGIASVSAVTVSYAVTGSAAGTGPTSGQFGGGVGHSGGQFGGPGAVTPRGQLGLNLPAGP